MLSRRHVASRGFLYAESRSAAPSCGRHCPARGPPSCCAAFAWRLSHGQQAPSAAPFGSSTRRPCGGSAGRSVLKLSVAQMQHAVAIACGLQAFARSVNVSCSCLLHGFGVNQALSCRWGTAGGPGAHRESPTTPDVRNYA